MRRERLKANYCSRCGNKLKSGTSTPWGMADQSKKIAPGIVYYSTPRHGGVHVSRGKLNIMFKRKPEIIKTVSEDSLMRNGWFEEDCDFKFVVYAFPELFPKDYLKNAVETLKYYYPEVFGVDRLSFKYLEKKLVKEFDSYFNALKKDIDFADKVFNAGYFRKFERLMDNKKFKSLVLDFVEKRGELLNSTDEACAFILALESIVPHFEKYL